MNDLVSIENGKLRVDSKVIADAFGKIHRNVLRDIESLDCSEEFRVLNFEQSSYRTIQGKTLPCIAMTKDGFAFLCMGFTGKEAAKWKEAFIKAFNKMEAVLRESSVSAMQSFNDALAIFEKDKDLASLHGKALAHWKVVRKEHIEAVTEAHSRAQLLLNFK